MSDTLFRIPSAIVTIGCATVESRPGYLLIGIDCKHEDGVVLEVRTGQGLEELMTALRAVLAWHDPVAEEVVTTKDDPTPVLTQEAKAARVKKILEDLSIYWDDLTCNNGLLNVTVNDLNGRIHTAIKDLETT